MTSIEPTPQIRPRRNRRLIAAILVMVLIVVAALIAIFGQSKYVMSPPPTGPNVAFNPSSTLPIEAARTFEFDQAAIEGDAIIGMILNCRNITPAAMNTAQLTIFGITLASVSNEQPAPGLTSVDLSIGYLNKAIQGKRAQLAAQALEAYDDLSNWKIATILIGAITTILVSIKSGFSDTGPRMRRSLSIVGFFAIVFSAAGTAAAALTAFYGPQDNYNNATRSLNDLRLLHAQMAAGVTQNYTGEICGGKASPDAAKALAGMVKQWSDQLAAAMGTSSSAGANSDPGKQGPARSYN